MDGTSIDLQKAVWGEDAAQSAPVVAPSPIDFEVTLALARTLADELSRITQSGDVDALRLARALALNVVDLIEAAKSRG